MNIDKFLDSFFNDIYKQLSATRIKWNSLNIINIIHSIKTGDHELTINEKEIINTYKHYYILLLIYDTLNYDISQCQDNLTKLSSNKDFKNILDHNSISQIISAYTILCICKDKLNDYNLDNYDTLYINIAENLLKNIESNDMKSFIIGKNNTHNLVKLIILKFLLTKDEFSALITNQSRVEKKNKIKNPFEKIIEKNVEKSTIVIYEKDEDITTYDIIESILNDNEKDSGFGFDLFTFLEENMFPQKFKKIHFSNIVDTLINNKYIFPITDDFIRYNRNLKPEFMDDKKDDNNRMGKIVKKVTDFKKLNNTDNTKEFIHEIDKSYVKSYTHRNAISYDLLIELNILDKLYKKNKHTIDDENYPLLMNIRKDISVLFDKPSYPSFYHYLSTKSTVFRHTSFHNSLIDKYKYSIKDTIETRFMQKNKVSITGIAIGNFKNILSTKLSSFIQYNNSIKNIISAIDNFFINKNNNIFFFFKNINLDYELNNENFINISSNENEDINTKRLILSIYDGLMFHRNNNIEKNIIENDHKSLTELIQHINDYKQEYDIFTDKEIDDQLLSRVFYEYSPKINFNNHKYDIDNIKLKPFNTHNQNLKCIHNHELRKISNLKRFNKNTKLLYHDIIFNFTKKYLDIGSDNNYICKSCGNSVNVKNFIADGTFSGDSKVFQFNYNPIFNPMYEDVLYKNVLESINLLHSITDKIIFRSGLIHLNNFFKIDNRLRIAVEFANYHSRFLGQLNNHRNQYTLKYGIRDTQSILSKLNIIRLTSDLASNKSTRNTMTIDLYITFICLTLIIDMGYVNIVSLPLSNDFNMKHFLPNINSYLEELRIKNYLNNDETKSLTSYPIFGYLLYYFANIVVSSNLWTTGNNLKKGMNIKERKQSINLTIKIVITTFVDILNTILFVGSMRQNDGKYQFILRNFYSKLSDNLYDNEELVNQLLEKKVKETKVFIKKGNEKVELEMIKQIPDKYIETPFKQSHNFIPK